MVKTGTGQAFGTKSLKGKKARNRTVSKPEYPIPCDLRVSEGFSYSVFLISQDAKQP